MAAAQALARGVDSLALRELAGLGRSKVRDAADLLDQGYGRVGTSVANTTGSAVGPGPAGGDRTAGREVRRPGSGRGDRCAAVPGGPSRRAQTVLRARHALRDASMDRDDYP